MKKYFLLSFFYLFISHLFAQDTNPPVNIYIDCNSCDITFIKQELKNVSYVRDQKDADVHLFFTSQENANGGDAYEIEFIGKNRFEKLHNSLHLDTNSDMSDLEINNKIIKYIRLGLIPYWIENGSADKLNISIKEDKKEDKKTEEDPWNKWSFRIGINGWFNGQESSKFYNLNGSFSGQQITEKNKFEFRIGISQNKSTFFYGDTEILSDKKYKYFRVSDIVSLNEHLSAGLFTNMGNSVYNNYKFYVNIKPGIEYNFFPYTESSKKQIIISYKLGGRYNNYYETTIFNKDKEFLWEQAALLGISFRKKWGSFSGDLEYISYLSDLSLNEFNFSLNTNIRIFKGLSVRLNGMYGITHDQINLSAEGATLEEMLLQQKQIRSGYNYFGSIGLNYTFGSIYNNIVNTRFDF